jgi:hypothetical protein
VSNRKYIQFKVEPNDPGIAASPITVTENQAWHTSLVDDSLRKHFEWVQDRERINAVISRTTKLLRRNHPERLRAIREALEGAAAKLLSDELAQAKQERGRA